MAVADAIERAKLMARTCAQVYLYQRLNGIRDDDDTILLPLTHLIHLDSLIPDLITVSPTQTVGRPTSIREVTFDVPEDLVEGMSSRSIQCGICLTGDIKLGWHWPHVAPTPIALHPGSSLVAVKVEVTLSIE